MFSNQCYYLTLFANSDFPLNLIHRLPRHGQEISADAKITPWLLRKKMQPNAGLWINYILSALNANRNQRWRQLFSK